MAAPAMVQQTAPYPLDWTEVRGSLACNLTIDGFDIHAEIIPDRETWYQEYDEDPATEYYVVGATASFRGVELASMGVHGCGILTRTPEERTHATAYLDDTAREMIAEALDQARAKLAELREG